MACATVGVILFRTRSVASHIMDFCYLFCYFQMKVLAYACINQSGDGAD